MPSAPPHPHSLPAEAVLAALDAGPEGLAGPEAALRLARFGPNVLPEPRGASFALIYLRQFKSPFIYLLVGAALVSLGLGDLTDAGFILGVLSLNAAIGSWQEWQAERRVGALARLVPGRIQALRDGRPTEIEARELVPGDIVRAESGLRLPADLRLIEAQGLDIDESQLTGESIAVTKAADRVAAPDAPLGDRPGMLYAGSTVLSGRGTGVVVATGKSTHLGQIADAMARETPPPPPLVQRMARFTRVVALAMVAIIAAIAAIEIARGAAPSEIFLLAVALAVSAIPEGLPVAMTVALSISVSRMARRQVAVRQLAAVEGLGACTLIASDKTGTLTQNQLAITALWLPRYGDVGPEHPAARAVAAAGSICNEAAPGPAGGIDGARGDAVDIAFLALADRHGQSIAALRAGTLSHIVYEPVQKYAAAFTLEDDRLKALVKGAPETVLAMCEAPATAAEAATALAARGLRVIAVAAGPVAAPDATALKGLSLVGLAGLLDPLRPGARDAVAAARTAGISVRMVTGDHPQTALAIARELDLAQRPNDVVTGSTLAAAPIASRDEMIEHARVFARIEPLQKLEIVQSLRRAGHVVAVTGDGVNDAVALHAADIGVAMGRSGTDVARDASDLVIIDDDFASIVAGIEEGRTAYDNLRKVIALVISTGAAEIVLFVMTTIFDLPAPLSAVQLLWLNLVTNGIQDVALAFERGEPGALKRPPRPPSQPIFDKQMIEQVVLGGATMGLIAFIIYAAFIDRGDGTEQARNAVLWLLVCLENAHCLNSRSETRSVFRVPLAANPLLVIGIAGTQLLQVAAMLTPGLGEILGLRPLAWNDWFELAAYALALILVMEIYKAIIRRRA